MTGLGRNDDRFEVAVTLQVHWSERSEIGASFLKLGVLGTW